MKIVIYDFFEVAVACTNNNEDIKKAAHAVQTGRTPENALGNALGAQAARWWFARDL